MKRAIGLPVILLMLGAIAMVSCSLFISKDEYERVVNDLEQANMQRGSIQAELETVQGQLGTAQSELKTVQGQLGSTQTELEAVQEQLDSTQSELEQLQNIYPPDGFQTVYELEDWAEDHLKSKTEYVDGTFRSAVEVQQEGLEDGYLIGIDIDYFPENDTYIVWCQAFAGNQSYVWYPIRGVYDGAWEQSSFAVK